MDRPRIAFTVRMRSEPRLVIFRRIQARGSSLSPCRVHEHGKDDIGDALQAHRTDVNGSHPPGAPTAQRVAVMGDAKEMGGRGPVRAKWCGGACRWRSSRKTRRSKAAHSADHGTCIRRIWCQFTGLGVDGTTKARFFSVRSTPSSPESTGRLLLGPASSNRNRPVRKTHGRGDKKAHKHQNQRRCRKAPVDQPSDAPAALRRLLRPVGHVSGSPARKRIAFFAGQVSAPARAGAARRGMAPIRKLRVNFLRR